MADAIALALDLGTTRIKVALLGADNQLQQVRALPAPPLHQDGARWQSDAGAYLETCRRLLAQYSPPKSRLLPLGLSCQRSSFLLWEAATGRPVSPLISWQDSRARAVCRRLTARSRLIWSKTGLPLLPYYFAPKVAWLLEAEPSWRRGLARGRLRIGTLDSFLIWHGSAGAAFQTDLSMAARTLLVDVETGAWSAALCDVFGLDPEWLPEITASEGLQLDLHNGARLGASLADQSAAVLASLGDRDEILVNLGTGGFVTVLSEQSGDGYLRSLIYQDRSGHSHFAREGTLNSIAVAVQGYPLASCRLADLGRQPALFCLAEPSGIGAPYFLPSAGPVFSAATEGLAPAVVAALLLEGIIFRVVRMIEDFRRHQSIRRVYLSGGLAHVEPIGLGIAALTALPLYRLEQAEASLLGAARLAAGMDLNANCGLGPVEPVAVAERLVDKYRGWCRWLDNFCKNKRVETRAGRGV